MAHPHRPRRKHRRLLILAALTTGVCFQFGGCGQILFNLIAISGASFF